MIRNSRTAGNVIATAAMVAIGALACSHARSEDLIARGVTLNRAEGTSHCRHELAGRMTASITNSYRTQAERDAAAVAVKSVVGLCVGLVDNHCLSEVMCAANVAVIRSDSFKLAPGEWRGLEVMQLTAGRDGIELAVSDRKGCKVLPGTPVAIIGRSPLIVMGRSAENLRCVVWL